MSDLPIPVRFDDGAAYAESMGRWSRVAGGLFLDWLAPPPALEWIDIGCGDGSFTSLLAERCDPRRLVGIDPSPAQLAQARRVLPQAMFKGGDAMALPAPDASFDAAVMALVMFFVPEPPRGLAEMVRVTRPGGIICAYVWDFPGQNSPSQAISVPLREMGAAMASGPPQADIARLPALRALWEDGGLENVRTETLRVERQFEDFEACWAQLRYMPASKDVIAAMTPAQVEDVKDRVRAALGVSGDGPVTQRGIAHAVSGSVPR